MIARIWTILAFIALLMASLDFQPLPEVDDPTCAECVEDCTRICGVPPCTEDGQAGCWVPEEEPCQDGTPGCVCDGAQGECREYPGDLPEDEEE